MIREKTWLFWEARFPFNMVWWKMNIQSFYTSPREITFGKLIKSQCELLPFGALCNLIASKFCQLNSWIPISFIIIFMIDLYKDYHVRASVRLKNVFLKKKKKKNFSSETIDWIFTRVSVS